MSKPYIGAKVKYCGHDGYFVADIFLVAGANVVRGNGRINGDTIIRPAKNCTHHLHDFPKSGFWGSSSGIFVVPQEQVVELVDIEQEDPAG